jgi:hypothetical protein
MHPDDEIMAIVIVTIRNALDSLFIVVSSYRKVAFGKN